MFEENLKKKFIELGYGEQLNAFEKYYKMHSENQLSSIAYKTDCDCSKIGYLGIHLLQNGVFRSKSLSLGWCDAFNGENEICINLIARGHLELTGTFSYLYKLLEQYQKKLY